MSAIIIECEQGSPEWQAARLGLPTASEFATILAKGKDGGASKTRTTYLYKLAGEILTGEIAETYTNAHMERGREMEAEARDLYSFMHDVEPQLVGFVRIDLAGCSPDSLIGDDGGLEIKCALPHVQIERLMKDRLPPEYVAQVQGCLWITGREWWDFVSYCPKLPLLVVRVARDEDYITMLSNAVENFSGELAALVERIRRYGQPSTLKDDLRRSIAEEK